MRPASEAYFSPDYFVARARFRAAAAAAGARLHALPIAARGPRDEPLTIDLAWLGAQPARRVLLHVTGVHGVEAFAGSATQLAALEAPPALPPGCALLFVHVLNPFGMAWLRRANENNVDLNRNALGPGERWEGAAPLYAALDRLLNPPSAPARDGFRLRLALLALRHGVRGPAQAIAEGQYEYPHGLFFGGRRLEEGPRRLLDWLQDLLASTEYLFVVDQHTGLGPYGESTLILEPGINVTPAATLAQALGQRLVDPAGGQAAYRARGTLGGALRSRLRVPRFDFVLQEIGTRSTFAVLSALRDENRCHHHAGASLDHPAKRTLREALSPSSVRWRRRAVQHGTSLVSAAADWCYGHAAPRARTVRPADATACRDDRPTVS